VVVRDEGPCIAPEDQARIFVKFGRAVSDRHYGGLGLGLYVADQWVRAMGGRIQAESQPGQGATFRLTLPRSALATAPQAERRDQGEAETVSQSPGVHPRDSWAEA
jgi:signal transduction histidine kinase